MFQEEYKAKFDAIPPDPEFRRQLEERIEEMKAPHVPKRKLPAATVAVLAALLILTTGALAASGTLGSIFQRVTLIEPWFSPEYPSSINLVKLSQMIDWEPQTETATFSNGSTAVVTLEEAFYDGNQIVLGWSMPDTTGNVVFIDKEDFTPGEVNNPFDGYPNFMDDDIIAEFEERYEKDGFACASYVRAVLDDDNFFVMGVGEHTIEFDDERGAVHCMPLGGGHELRWKEDDTFYLLDLDIYGLPEAVKDKDSLPMTHYVTGKVYYYYQDETGSYLGNWGDEWPTVTVEVPRTTSIEKKTASFTAQFPNHTADITVTSSPVQFTVDITNNISEEDIQLFKDYDGRWSTYPKNLERDVIEYYAIYIDGEQYQAGWGQYFNYHILHVIAPPEGCEQIAIRPIYVNSGEHPEEDIVFDLSTMTVISE